VNDLTGMESNLLMPRFILKTRGNIFIGLLWCFTNLTAFADLPPDQLKLAAANTGFAFDLLKQVAKEQPGTNIFISPFSISAVLQMAANGTVGGTRAEMRQVLRTTGLPPTSLNAAYQDLNQFLNSQSNGIMELTDLNWYHETLHRSNNVLNLANAIWYRNDYHLKPGFVSVSKHYFQTELGGVDFARPESAQTINDWAERSTHGKIKDIVQWPFDNALRVILANVIYFKGNWADPFDESETRPQPFHLATGKEKQVPMMWQKGEYNYQENADFRAMALTYVNPFQQMYVLLPRRNSSLKKLIAGLDGGIWQNTIYPQFKRRKGSLMLPKFNIEYGIKLNSPLKALGMKLAFDDRRAEFSAMSDEFLYISEIKHKTFIEVNEKGTEAAAVTQFSLSKGGDRSPPFEMVVDRPFLFVIFNSYTKTILFLGVVYDPVGQGGGS
jgi:serpin B